MTPGEIVDYFVELAQNRPRKKASKAEVNAKLDALETIAQSNGLGHRNIIKLVDAVGGGTLAHRTSVRIIKSLIPETTVPELAVLKAISWMCTNKSSSAIQAYLIRWVVLIYDLLDSDKNIHALYGTIFFFLENDTMCPHVCHLLYLLTRQEDVRLFRVRALINLQNRIGNQSYILGLLSIFKIYCPQLVSITMPRVSKSFFKQNDTQWAAKIRYVKEKSHTEQREDVSFNSLAIGIAEQPQPAAKRRRLEVVPTVDVCSVHYPTGPTKNFTQQKVPLKIIKTQKDLIAHVDNIEMPSRIGSVLKNRIFQHLISIQSDHVVPLRLGYWLHHTLNEEFFHPLTSVKKDRQGQLLEMLCNFAEFLQESMPIWENFLTRYLLTWNGFEHLELILKLITRLRLSQAEALMGLVLEPLRKLFFSSSVMFKCQVIWCLSRLLRNFVAVEWPRYKDIIASREDTTAPAHSFESKPCMNSVFDEDIEPFPGLHTIKMLIEFVDHISIFSLSTENNHALLYHCLTDFHYVVTRLYSIWQIPILILPNESFIYQAMFSSNVTTFGRLVELFTLYRKVFENLRRHAKSLPPLEAKFCIQSVQNIAQFNKYLLDMCNLIWRNKAFEASSEARTIFSLISKDHLEMIGWKRNNKAFSINCHPALIGHSLKFLDETQPQGRNVHVISIQTWRDKFLEYLEMEHLDVIPEFIATSIQRSEKTPSPASRPTRKSLRQSFQK